MKHICLLLLAAFPFLCAAQSQGVGVGTPSPNPSAALDITSTNKGLLIPRLSTYQRTTTITNPAAGLLVYDTDTKGFWYYSGTAWVSISGGSNVKSIYISGSALGFTPSANITQAVWGLNLTSTAGTVNFAIPKPIDWDSTKTFTVAIHFSMPSNNGTTNSLSWRLQAGANIVNTTNANQSTGWDSYDYWAVEDAPLLTAYQVSGAYPDLAKTQSWTAKFSSTYNTWYFGNPGVGVTVANSFSDNAMWHFGFQRGSAISNGESYTGVLTVNGVTITYASK